MRVAWLVGFLYLGIGCWTAHAQVEDPFAEGDADTDSGPELGARAGYVSVTGPLTNERTQRDAVIGLAEVAVDLGYRSKAWFFGGYGGYGFGIVSNTSRSACPGCAHSRVHLGLQVQRTLFETSKHQIWLGLGTGREWFNTTISRERGANINVTGWEYASLHLGSSWRLLSGLTLGPFTSLSLGDFTNSVETCSDRSTCPSDQRRVERSLAGVDLHASVTTGVRITALP
jgi:hypothetical protein